MEWSFQLHDIQRIAQEVLEQRPKKILLFNGAMGAGKTTFIKSLCQVLGVKTSTSSPTFSLVNEYETPSGALYHFDLYRLKNEIEALDMGIDEYLYSGNWCFIEWAEKIPDLIPQEHSVITITVGDNEERILHLDI